ncbi:acyl carrier protein [Cellulosilyticum sp. ST5]|uniref:Acyl carrier protein n=1 Tax=Cellulosilyticum lentocellum (strain ATCC 49066 / DSM 5427 / NCIMB 11756 / RHM5) TaxID=642492 RepID=F2JNH4_CELLD|nr:MULTISPECIES: acyl carrier protein [Cellulosilyticum]ADZ84750.1 acyl carrier protein [Cellulosilyticum lentocellum DSM 5427]QEH70224.1 acyl carrier protein [Cellulosilyticum sp. WCF-2]
MLERLQAVIADKLSVEVSEVTPEATFREDLGADSLDLFEVVMGIEEEFGISIENEDLEKIQTVGDALAYITDKQ